VKKKDEGPERQRGTVGSRDDWRKGRLGCEQQFLVKSM